MTISIVLATVACGDVSSMAAGTTGAATMTAGESSGLADDSSAGPSSTTASDEDPPLPAGPCLGEQRVGRFTVAVDESYSSVAGEIRDGIVWPRPRETLAQTEACFIDRPADPSCDPPCSGSDQCTPTGECVPYPELVPAGDVTIAGLEESIVMTPVGDGSYFATGVVHPLFDQPRTARLTAAGDAIAAFSIASHSFAPLDIEGHVAWSAASGSGMAIAWAEAAPHGQRVRVSLSIDTHGTAPMRLVCDVEDTGSFAVPESLMTTLVDGGASGLPLAELARVQVSHTVTPDGCVEFELVSRATPTVELP